MSQVHFAGINTMPLAHATVGHHILVSYADVVRRPGVWEKEIRPRLEAGEYAGAILDSGAFTELTERQRGVKNPLHVDVDAYAAFARETAGLWSWVVSLDDIGGDLGRSWRNQARLEELGVPAVPVFHQGEPWAVLDSYADKYPRVGLGFGRVKGQIAPGAEAWLTAALARIDGRCLVHGFGMTRHATRGAPLDTTDSTSWIAEYRSLSKRADFDPEAMTCGPHPDKHGLGGDLGVLFCLEPWDLLEVVLASYQGTGTQECNVLTQYGGEYADQATGQARTMLRRFAPGELEAVLTRQELRRTLEREEIWAEAGEISPSDWKARLCSAAERATEVASEMLRRSWVTRGLLALTQLGS